MVQQSVARGAVRHRRICADRRPGRQWQGGVRGLRVNGTTWAQQGAKLTGKKRPARANRRERGALKGEYALIGGSGDNSGVRGGSSCAAARVGPSRGKLTGKGESGKGFFGWTLSAETGDYALIGGPGDKEGVGAAWCFCAGDLGLSGDAHLKKNAQGRFGYSVALSSNGEYALIVGRRTNANVGAAWVLPRSGYGPSRPR